MVDAAVSIAIEKLGGFVIQEVNIRIGVKDAVKWLKDELSYLLISVRAAEANQEMPHIRLWIDSVKDVANEAVIILERFSTHQEEHPAPKQGVLDRMQSFICICKKEVDLYDIGKDIESLKERVVGIKNRRDEFRITDIIVTPKVQERKRTLLRATSFQNNADVVGFEDDVQTLMDVLVREDSSLTMISIHGMGGLGKSTLAGKLYHSKELSHFKNRAWVCVSEDYNIIHVLKKIIKSFMGHEPDSLIKMDEVDLLRHLRKLLVDGDHYLVVIDDIWDIKVWNKIKEAFPDKENGSRIIITTRSKEVAEGVDARCVVHELRFLREDESWQLFCKKANPTPNLEKLGKEMVRKCGGLPLAIVVLSGLLLHKSYEDWSKVNDHLWRRLKGKSAEIQEILSLSYDDLSFQMRQCFLYLARYPEDRTFEIQDLKLLWIAEEFISEANEGDGVIMEDVAEDYLNELINRNMIQIAFLKFNGESLECRVHDLVRDLAIQKATEDKLLGIFDSSKQHPSHISLLQGQPRHAIHNGIGEYLNLLGPSSDNLKLRSLAVIYRSGRLELEEMKLMYARFKNLKVLDLRRVKSDRIPEEIGDLVLLKFLGLMKSCSYEQTLVIPPSIGKLKKLQTLYGMASSKYEFPREICELKELRHLKFDETRGGFNIGSHQTKLHTVDTIGYSEWIKIDTVNLTNLHKLAIQPLIEDEEENDSYSLESIANLKSLQTLILKFYDTHIPTMKPLSSCQRLKNVDLWGKLADPTELRFLPHSVTSLVLGESKFKQDPMPTLGSLSNLTFLFALRTYKGKKMVCSHDAFPSLQFLAIKYFRNLEEWQVEDGALPSLKGFKIEGCDKLKMVPELVKCVPPIPNICNIYVI